MKHTPLIEIIHCNGGLFYVVHPGRSVLLGKYLGVKKGKIDWTTHPIYFGSRKEASDCLFDMQGKKKPYRLKEVTKK